MSQCVWLYTNAMTTLSKGFEHPQILVSAGGSWNQYPTETEGWLCGFDRYKDEKGKGKIQKKIDTIEILFLIIATSPQLWSAGEQNVY